MWEVTKTGTATSAKDTACACSRGSSCDRNTQERAGDSNMRSRKGGGSDVHVPEASAAMVGGVQSRRSAVATAHMNSISGESSSGAASPAMVSHEKMYLQQQQHHFTPSAA